MLITCSMHIMYVCVYVYVCVCVCMCICVCTRAYAMLQLVLSKLISTLVSINYCRFVKVDSIYCIL